MTELSEDVHVHRQKSIPFSSKAQIAILSTRIDGIENQIEKKGKSKSERFMAWAGVLGLSISMLTGGFTIFDRVVIEPNAQAMTAFQAAIDGITKINQDVASRAAQETNPSKAAAIAASRNLEKWRFLREAETQLPKVQSRITPQDYYVLATEEANTNRFDKAIEFSKEAEILARRGNDRTELSEILRLEAQVTSMAQAGGGVETARALFAEAQAVLAKERTYGSSFLRARVAAEAVVLEAFWGDCAKIPALLNKFQQERDRSDVLGPNRALLHQNLIQQLNNQARCSVTVPPLAGLQSTMASPR